MNTTKTTAEQEYKRVQTMLSGLTGNLPIMLMSAENIGKFAEMVISNSLMAETVNELRDRLRSIKVAEDYLQMSQAYEAYAEANVCFELARRDVRLERTPGTGEDKKKRPDFTYRHGSGNIYFEVKALEIVGPLTRHKEMADGALEAAADLDARARSKPGVHFSETEFSGFKHSTSASERIDIVIERINNTVKTAQLRYGPTVLMIDLGRLPVIPFGPSALLPVFFHDGPPAESCVSGELWHIALGNPGERIFRLPKFDGRSNLDGHLKKRGILHDHPGLVAISFVFPSWSGPAEILTIWNVTSEQSALQNKLTLEEHEVDELLAKFSDGLNDDRNERGWEYRVSPLRPDPADDEA